MTAEDTPRPALPHSGREPHLLRDIVRTHQLLMDVASREIGVTVARLGVMRVLAVLDERERGVLHIARELGVDAAAVTRQVQDLEKEGIAERTRDPRDGRRAVIRLTEKGRRVFADLHERAHALEEALVAGLPATDVAAAGRVLGQVRAILEARR